MSRLRRDCRGGDSPPAGVHCAPLHGAQNGLLTSQSYGNGDSVSFTYDNLGRVKTTTYSDGRVLTYCYTGDGQLYSVHDSKTGFTYQYSYDSLGRLMSSSVKDENGNVLTTRQTYDANNQMTAQSWQMGSDSYSEVYTYSLTTGLLATHTPAVGSKRTYNYDVLQRLSSVTGGVYGKSYTYRDISDTNTTTQVAGLTYDLAMDIIYGYTYDQLGNIATYTEGDTTYTYTYDAQNQLLSQTDGTNTWTYTYDAAGNILTASDGTASHSYTYGNSTWKDLLTAFDGQSITYDGAGNPTSYYNGTRWSMTWEEGRRLVSANNGTTNLTFTYDSEGLRLSKTVGTTEHNYYYAGGKLLRETWGSNTLDFFYDAMGTAYAVKYNGTLYYYITNLQGDILHIVDASGATVVSYTYSPYGKVLSTTGTLADTLGVDNPLRYRSYYYDIDSGLYYLQSRYYDPELCRFLNADSYASTGQGLLGCNMFGYCNNNPVNCCDPCGTCVHRKDFWNNCEKCTAFWNGVGEWFVDAYNTVNNAYIRQIEAESEITMQQIQMTQNVAKRAWDLHVHSVEMDIERQKHHDRTVIIASEFARDNPGATIDMALTIVGLAALYYGSLASCGVITIPTGLTTALNIGGGVSTVWGSFRTTQAVFQKWTEYYEERLEELG